MTKIEWLELAKTNLLDYSPQVALKCINEVIELEKGGKDNNPNYHASICSSCSPITEKPCHICGVHLTYRTGIVKGGGMTLQINEIIENSYDKGFIDGLTAYAHWKDGKQKVGTSDKSLTEAVIERKQTWNYIPLAKI